MLSDDEAVDIAVDLWARQKDELPALDRIYRYLHGLAGRPNVPEGAGDELEDISKMSVKNVLELVVASFSQSLVVTGFRSPDDDTDEAVWSWWQENNLDARQSEAVRPAVAYGTSYATVLRDVIRLRTPRQTFAVYADPSIDMWPVYAIETWLDRTEKRPRRVGRLLDDVAEYPLDFGYITKAEAESSYSTPRRLARPVIGEPVSHGAIYNGEPVCPVVRFVNDRDAEALVRGEVEPLITQQRAINTVNFDRLCVSRFGAFPQKYVVGWDPSREEAIKASVARVLAFADDFVKPGSFAAATVTPYNEILKEMLEHVALTAQIPLRHLTGDLTNLSAEALAAADAMQQRKLAAKRNSFGESWEQVLRLGAGYRGIEVSDTAEVIWLPTEIQSFPGVVDGIGKLAVAGVPIDSLVDDIPGWSQQRADATRSAIRREQGRGVLNALTAAAERVTGGDAVNQ